MMPAWAPQEIVAVHSDVVASTSGVRASVYPLHPTRSVPSPLPPRAVIRTRFVQRPICANSDFAGFSTTLMFFLVDWAVSIPDFMALAETGFQNLVGKVLGPSSWSISRNIGIPAVAESFLSRARVEIFLEVRSIQARG